MIKSHFKSFPQKQKLNQIWAWNLFHFAATLVVFKKNILAEPSGGRLISTEGFTSNDIDSESEPEEQTELELKKQLGILDQKLP